MTANLKTADVRMRTELEKKLKKPKKLKTLKKLKKLKKLTMRRTRKIRMLRMNCKNNQPLISSFGRI